MGKLSNRRYESSKPQTHSPDLAYSDFHLFPNLKKFLPACFLRLNEVRISAVDGYCTNHSDPLHINYRNPQR